MTNPYKSIKPNAFWKRGVEKSDITFPSDIYTPKWKLADTDKIATMGSCFAQHIANWLRENGFNAPLYEDTESFSARYGNVYTVRQALQLVEESIGLRTPSEVAWAKDDKFIDAIRPNVFKDKFKTSNEVLEARESHLYAVQAMVKDFDILIFTLGLTEAWEITKCGTIVPTAPGVLAGDFDPDMYQFINFKHSEVMDDLNKLCDILRIMRNDKPFRLLLTVSPVPLTATATDNHILLASTYSKAVLRSVAGDFVEENEFAEYFPSFEIITNPAARSDFFEDNLRSVKMSAVGNVMSVFSALALDNPRITTEVEEFDPDCEDALLEEFSGDKSSESSIVCVGDSHLAGFRSNIPTAYFFPSNWGKYGWTEFHRNKNLTHFLVRSGYEHLIEEATIQDPDTLVLVGLGLAGDGIIRCNGLLSRDSSPTMSVINTFTVSRPLIKFYRNKIESKLHPVATQLVEHSPYKNVFWIACPDMCLDVATHRLGGTFVNSGSYLIHKKAYMVAFNECMNKFKKIKFIFHDDNLCDPDTGFTLNQYQASDNLADIHCSPEYYKDAVAKIH